MVIDLWKRDMEKTVKNPNARAMNISEMIAYTKMEPAIRFTGAKTVNNGPSLFRYRIDLRLYALALRTDFGREIIGFKS
jgi:hypothetical protein